VPASIVNAVAVVAYLSFSKEVSERRFGKDPNAQKVPNGGEHHGSGLRIFCEVTPMNQNIMDE